MSPGRFRALLLACGLSSRAAGALLGASDSTVEKWSGKLKPYRAPPRSVWLALALLADAGWRDGDPLPQYLPREDKNAANRARYAAARYSQAEAA